MIKIKNNDLGALKVVGIGGAGSNVVSYMEEKGMEGVDFVLMNTDEDSLERRQCANKVLLKAERYGEGQYQAGRASAIASRDNIVKALQGAQIAVLVAGLGGSTGSGALPVIAQIAKEMHILPLCIVITPFWFEGKARMQKAQECVQDMRQIVDSLIVFSNDELLKTMDKNMSTEAAFDGINELIFQEVCKIRAIALKKPLDDSSLWEKGLAEARQASEEVQTRIQKEYESPCSYMMPEGFIEAETAAWLKIKDIPRHMLTWKEGKLLDSLTGKNQK